jgi:hypothetical protein
LAEQTGAFIDDFRAFDYQDATIAQPAELPGGAKEAPCRL